MIVIKFADKDTIIFLIENNLFLDGSLSLQRFETMRIFVFLTTGNKM